MIYFLISLFLFICLIHFLNIYILKKLDKENKLRKFWERHICSDINWLDDEEL